MYIGKIAENVRPKTAISLIKTPRCENTGVKRKETDNNLNVDDFIEGKSDITYININNIIRS